MNQNKKIKSLLLVGGFAALAGLYGCVSSGDTDGGTAGTDSGLGGEFVSDDTVGTLSLSVVSSTMAVGETSGFTVTLLNGAGQAVPNARISCDTEEGVAIIEPSTGSELTSGFEVSRGRIGCAAPGSYEMACRGPVGINKRKFVTIKCTGDVPDGFDGFPGSGGGTLGGGTGGSDNGNPGGTNLEGFTLSSLTLAENGQTPVVSVDTCIDTCVQEDASTDAVELTCEGAQETYFIATFTNDTNQTIKLTNYAYTVPDVGSNDYDSGTIPMDLEVLPNTTADSPATTTYQGLLLSINSSFSSDGTSGAAPGQTGSCLDGASASFKAFIGLADRQISCLSGLYQVTVTFTGESSDGTEIEIAKTIPLNASNTDNCG